MQILQDEVFGKRLQLLKEARANLSRVAFLDESVTPRVGPHTSKQEAARSLGLELPFMASHERNIIDSLVRYRIAAIHSLKRFVEADGFMSYGAGFSEIYRRDADP